MAKGSWEALMEISVVRWFGTVEAPRTHVKEAMRERVVAHCSRPANDPICGCPVNDPICSYEKHSLKPLAYPTSRQGECNSGYVQFRVPGEATDIFACILYSVKISQTVLKRNRQALQGGYTFKASLIEYWRTVLFYNTPTFHRWTADSRFARRTTWSRPIV